MFQALLLGLASSIVNFSGVDLTIPHPKGYCLPSGNAELTAQQFAAADSGSVTKLTLVNCDPRLTFEDYLNVKVPAHAVDLTMNRPEFLELMRKTFASAGFSEFVKSGKAQSAVEGHYRAVGAKDAKVAGGLVPRKIDETCGYLGGDMTVTSGGQTKSMTAAACMTSIGGRIMSLYAIKPKGDNGSYESLFVELRQWAQSIEKTASASGRSKPGR